jgi:uncharacterized membrane protein YesL
MIDKFIIISSVTLFWLFVFFVYVFDQYVKYDRSVKSRTKHSLDN